MGRHFRNVLIIGTAAVAALSPGSAQAAETFTIHSAVNGQNPSLVLSGFTATKCNAAFLGDPINGLDARVVDVGPRKGTTIGLSFTTGNAVTDSLASFTTTQVVFDSACNSKPLDLQETGPRKGTLALPTNAKWLVVTGFNAVEFKFTITP